MRIAFVCDWCLPRFGGLELQLVDLATALEREGHSVHIYTAAPGPPQANGIAVTRLNGLRMPGAGFTCSTRQFRELRQGLRDGAYDVVHVHSSLIAPLAYGGAWVAAREGFPTAVTFHSVYDYLKPGLQVLRLLDRATEQRIAWSAVSSLVAHEVGAAIGDGRVELLPNGVDPAKWAAPRAPRDPSVLRLASVMRLQVRKRPTVLFRVLDEALRRLAGSVTVTLDIYGDGPERRAVERMAAERSGVRVHGRRDRSEIRGAFTRTDAFLLPTRMEAFGIAALEALCAGVPVIAVQGSGVADFVKPGENGLLGRTVPELATAVVDLARNEPLRAELARRTQVGTAVYSWPAIVRRTLAQYERAGCILP